MADLPPSAIAAVCGMGEIATDLWRRAATAFVERRAECADGLDRRDDDLDSLVAGLGSSLSGDVPREAVIDLALLGRFYERLGDHAVHLARNIRFLITGEPATG